MEEKSQQSGEVLDVENYFPDLEEGEEEQEDWVPKTPTREEQKLIVSGDKNHWKSQLPPFGIPLQGSNLNETILARKIN